MTDAKSQVKTEVKTHIESKLTVTDNEYQI